MKYSVYYNNNVEVNKVAEFDTLKEAKEYCAEETEGCDEVCDGDNCYEGHSNNFHYEVYEGDSCAILDEDGDVVEFKDPVYETKYFYCD
jgi:hypothetical protein